MKAEEIMRILLTSLFILALVLSATAQTPNTGAIVVVVADQSGAVVSGAFISVVNKTNGTSRDAVSGGNREVTIAALPVTGTYQVEVNKSGFTSSIRKDIALRAGETARLEVKLVASGGESAIQVYGTSSG